MACTVHGRTGLQEMEHEATCENMGKCGQSNPKFIRIYSMMNGTDLERDQLLYNGADQQPRLYSLFKGDIPFVWNIS